MLASLALYHSFELGTMSIVGPVSSSYPALTVALSFLSGERIHAVRAIGLAVTLLGVILAATSFSQSRNTQTEKHPELPTAVHVEQERAHLSAGVGWAICAALGFGVLFWFLGFHVVPCSRQRCLSLGHASHSTRRAFSSSRADRPDAKASPRQCLVAAPRRRHPGHRRIRRQQRRPSTGQVSVVSVLASLYGAVTVLLSWIFLRERLERSQWFGIILIFIGIVLVSL